MINLISRIFIFQIIGGLLLSVTAHAERLLVAVDNRLDKEVTFYLSYKDTRGNAMQKNLTLKHNRLKVLLFTAIDPLSVEYPSIPTFTVGAELSLSYECKNKFKYDAELPFMCVIINPDSTCDIN